MGKKKDINLSYDDLYQLYITENKTKNEIGKLYNCSGDTIFKYIKKYNIIKPKNLIYQSSCNAIIKKYGVSNVFQSDEIKQKMKETNLKKYGVENPSQSNDIKKKKEKAALEKYGVSNVFQSDEIKQKMKETNLKKYGVENPLKSEEIRNKMKETLYKKYEHYYPKQLNEISIKYFMDKETAKEYIINNFKGKTPKYISEITKISYPQILRYLKKYELYDLVNFKPASTSSYEELLTDFLISLGITNIEHNKKNIIKNKEIDLYIPEYKIGIEINGTYWHSDIWKNKNYHLEKSKNAESNGIRLIHIYEYEITNKVTFEKIKSLLRIAFCKTESRIYARKCEIKEITNKEAKPFNDANHLQGHRNASITYGLYYNDKLVQLMSFSKHNKYEWEIIRGCPGSNNIVVGGVGKLFKHFIKEKDPKQVFSYCDFNKFDGKSYESIGMTFIGYSGPDKTWLINSRPIHRNAKRYKELAAAADAIIWGAGSKKYLWTKEKTEN